MFAETLTLDPVWNVELVYLSIAGNVNEMTLFCTYIGNSIRYSKIIAVLRPGIVAPLQLVEATDRCARLGSSYHLKVLPPLVC